MLLNYSYSCVLNIELFLLHLDWSPNIIDANCIHVPEGNTEWSMWDFKGSDYWVGRRGFPLILDAMRGALKQAFRELQVNWELISHAWGILSAWGSGGSRV